jgi:predicted CoA-binding protein
MSSSRLAGPHASSGNRPNPPRLPLSCKPPVSGAIATSGAASATGGPRTPVRRAASNVELDSSAETRIVADRHAAYTERYNRKNMPHTNPSDQAVKELLTNAKTIAMVGASSSPDRPSHGIMQRLQRVGYRVIPINPRETEILGEKAYATLADVPDPIDIVDVFRRADDTPPIADEAVKVGAKALWLQSGISSEDAAARAEAGGLTVVMDACIGSMHSMLQVPKK